MNIKIKFNFSHLYNNFQIYFENRLIANNYIEEF